MLADGCTNFRRFAIEDTQVNEERIAELVSRSLMLVTAIAPIVGYDNAARIAHKAAHDGTTLREAALASGLIDADDLRPRNGPAADDRQGPFGGLSLTPRCGSGRRSSPRS